MVIGKNTYAVLPSGAVAYLIADELAVDSDGAPPDANGGPPGGDRSWDPHTALRAADGSSVDASTVPYLAVGGVVLRTLGAQQGDLASVRRIDGDGWETEAIIADSPGGGSVRAHEVSMELHRRLGGSGDPTGRGASVPGGSVLVILYPGSSEGWPTDLTREMDLLRSAGGWGAAYAAVGLDPATAPTVSDSMLRGAILASVAFLGILLGVIL